MKIKLQQLCLGKFGKILLILIDVLNFVFAHLPMILCVDVSIQVETNIKVYVC